MSIVTSYYAALSLLFSPVLVLPLVVSELLMVAIMTFIITLFYRYLVNQDAVRALKQQIKERQAKAKELQKSNPEQANTAMSEMLKLNNQQMRLQFRPMLPTMLLVLAVFPWLATIFSGFAPALPFHSDLISALAGMVPPWLLWYILISLPLSQLFRKLLGVE